MEQVALGTAPMLKSFIHTREFDSPNVPRTSKWSWPKKKGTVEQAGLPNCDNLRKHLMCHDEAQCQSPWLSRLRQMVQQERHAGGRNREQGCVDPAHPANTPADRTRANTLALLLQTRLRRHLSERIKDPAKREHLCLRWFAQNIPRVAALSVLFGHVKRDIACATDESGLLSGVHNFVRAEGAVAELELCYLRGAWP